MVPATMSAVPVGSRYDAAEHNARLRPPPDRGNLPASQRTAGPAVAGARGRLGVVGDRKGCTHFMMTATHLPPRCKFCRSPKISISCESLRSISFRYELTFSWRSRGPLPVARLGCRTPPCRILTPHSSCSSSALASPTSRLSPPPRIAPVAPPPLASPPDDAPRAELRLVH